MNKDLQSGFSLIELMVVLAIMGTILSVAIVNFPAVRTQDHVNEAYTRTMSVLRQGRETAISQRRVYIVTITAPGTITLVPQNPVTDINVLAINVTTTLPTDVQFSAEAGIPNTAATTPDGIGQGQATGAIDFDVNVGAGGSNVIYFWPDGSARDVAGNINDGVLYIAKPGVLMSSRAISLRGLTGRLRGWTLKKNAGVTSWAQM